MLTHNAHAQHKFTAATRDPATPTPATMLIPTLRPLHPPVFPSRLPRILLALAFLTPILTLTPPLSVSASPPPMNHDTDTPQPVASHTYQLRASSMGVAYKIALNGTQVFTHAGGSSRDQHTPVELTPGENTLSLEIALPVGREAPIQKFDIILAATVWQGKPVYRERTLITLASFSLPEDFDEKQYPLKKNITIQLPFFPELTAYNNTHLEAYLQAMTTGMPLATQASLIPALEYAMDHCDALSPDARLRYLDILRRLDLSQYADQQLNHLAQNHPAALEQWLKQPVPDAAHTRAWQETLLTHALHTAANQLAPDPVRARLRACTNAASTTPPEAIRENELFQMLHFACAATTDPAVLQKALSEIDALPAPLGTHCPDLSWQTFVSHDFNALCDRDDTAKALAVARRIHRFKLPAKQKEILLCDILDLAQKINTEDFSTYCAQQIPENPVFYLAAYKAAAFSAWRKGKPALIKNTHAALELGVPPERFQTAPFAAYQDDPDFRAALAMERP